MAEELISLTVPSTIQEFPLGSDSIIFIVGAYSGKHAQFYVDKYDPYMYLFEPQKILARQLMERFEKNPKVKVLSYGLGEVSGRFELSRLGTDRCSFVPRMEGMDNGESPFEGPHARGRIVEIGEFMGKEGIDHVDLCLMNCEGYEFRLLPWIVKGSTINKIKYLMVQFHMHHQGSELMDEIKGMIRSTHTIRDDYEPAWIVWGRREKPEVKLIYGHPGLQTYRTDRGILQVVNKKHGDEKYRINLKGIHNAADKLRILDGSGFTPHLLAENKGSILQEDIGISEAVEGWSQDDWQDFRRHLVRFLILLRQKNIRHGDLNGNNIVIRNKRPWIIDWQESHFIGEKPPQKGPMHDTCWLFGNLVRWIGKPDLSDPYRVSRRWNHISGDLMRSNDCSLPLKGKTLLDVGCFQGDFAAMAAVEMMEVTGMDPGGFRSGENSIEIARQLWPNVPNLKFAQEDLVNWDDFHYDIILFMDTFPHIVRSHGAEIVIRKLNEMVAQAGRVYFETQMHGDQGALDWLRTDEDVFLLCPGAMFKLIATIPEKGNDRKLWKITKGVN